MRRTSPTDVGTSATSPFRRGKAKVCTYVAIITQSRIRLDKGTILYPPNICFYGIFLAVPEREGGSRKADGRVIRALLLHLTLRHFCR